MTFGMVVSFDGGEGEGAGSTGPGGSGRDGEAVHGLDADDG
jgi:hypothetical protein